MKQKNVKADKGKRIERLVLHSLTSH